MVFSKVDANSDFWQVALDESSRELTTFITPFSRYRFNRLLFWISSALKAIFSHHGIPAAVVSDNGPQHASQDMKEFSQSYGFSHITSSLHFPQSIGEAERAVRTAKSFCSIGETTCNNVHCSLVVMSKSISHLWTRCAQAQSNLHNMHHI